MSKMTKRLGTHTVNKGATAATLRREKASKGGRDAQKEKHTGPHTRVTHPQMHGSPGNLGSNLKFKNTTQAVHVAEQKDTMAHNVGGSAAHMMVDSKSLGYQNLIESGGKSPSKARKVREKY